MVNGVPLVNEDAAILSPAEWSRLAALMRRNEGKAWTRQTGFGRVLACGECGERLYLQLSKRNPDYATYRCRKPAGVHPVGAPGVSVMVHAANDFVESDFLAMWGSEPYRMVSVSDDDTARREAIASANIRIDETNRRMRSACRSELAQLSADLVAAYGALSDADAIPSERREVVSDTGQTIGEVWAESDSDTRERIACAFGRYVVRPGTPGGRGALPDRVTWEGLKPDAVRLNGEPAQIALVDAPDSEQPNAIRCKLPPLRLSSPGGGVFAFLVLGFQITGSQ